MKLGELANELGLPLHGDAGLNVSGLAAVANAQPTELAFVVSAKYSDALRNNSAGAVIVPEAMSALASQSGNGNHLISTNPYASYARASWLLSPDNVPTPGIHPTAIIAASATIDAGVTIGAFTTVDHDAVIKTGAIVAEHCTIGAGCVIGEGTRFFARVSLYRGCSLGRECRVQSGAVIGSEGFGFAFDKGWLPIHQTGNVVIGNSVHIGANTTIDRGALDDTQIKDGVIMDNQIQIAHNVCIGENTAIAGCVGIAGSTIIGKNCQIGGACNIVGHLKIADGVTLSATSFVSQSINEPGRYSSGMPLQSSQRWRRSFVTLGKLDELLKRIRRLEKRN